MNSIDKEILKFAGKIAVGAVISVMGYVLDNGGEVAKPLGYLAYGGGVGFIVYRAREKIKEIKSQPPQ